MPDRSRTRRRGLFLWMFFIILLLVSYTIYWFYMANQLTIGVEDWIDDQREAGYRMEHGGLDMSGFPYRFNLDVTAPDVTTPDGAWRVQGEKLTLVMQPWNWSHVISYSNGRHIITNPDGEEIIATAQGAQGSFSWDEESITRISLVADMLDATQDNAPIVSGQGFYLHVSPFPEAPEDLRIRTGFTTLNLPEAPRDAQWLGTTAGPVDAPIRISRGMTLLETGGDIKAAIRALNPEFSTPLTQISWGPLKAKLKTDGLGLDGLDRPSGALNVRLEDIDALKTAIAASGDLTEDKAIALDAFKAGPRTETSFLPFIFKDGKAKFMFLTVAELDPVF